jgi:hypothetical protein
MNANELADDAKNISNTIEALEFVQKAVPMLRQFGLAESIIKQQQLEIEALKDEVAEWKMSYENCHRMCSGYGMN